MRIRVETGKDYGKVFETEEIYLPDYDVYIGFRVNEQQGDKQLELIVKGPYGQQNLDVPVGEEWPPLRKQ